MTPGTLDVHRAQSECAYTNERLRRLVSCFRRIGCGEVECLHQATLRNAHTERASSFAGPMHHVHSGAIPLDVYASTRTAAERLTLILATVKSD
jgi:hypothetical protein